MATNDYMNDYYNQRWGRRASQRANPYRDTPQPPNASQYPDYNEPPPSKSSTYPQRPWNDFPQQDYNVQQDYNPYGQQQDWGNYNPTYQSPHQVDLSQYQQRGGSSRGGGFGGAARGAMGGASRGSALGSFVPGIGSAIGGAVGGVVGGIAGLFNRRAASAPTDYNVNDAQDAIRQAYRQYLGREGSNDEIMGHLRNISATGQISGQWVGSTPLNYILQQIQGSPEAMAYTASPAGQGQTQQGTTTPTTQQTISGLEADRWRRGGASSNALRGGQITNIGAGSTSLNQRLANQTPTATTTTPGATTLGQYTGSLEGFDATKLNNPEHRTGKYTAARAMSNLAPTTENLPALVQQLQSQGYPNARVVGRDSIDLGDGFGAVDVIRDVQGGTGGWQWLNRDAIAQGGGASPVDPTGMPVPGGVGQPGPPPVNQAAGGGGFSQPGQQAYSMAGGPLPQGGGATPQPASGWVQLPNGDWVPPDHPLASQAGGGGFTPPRPTPGTPSTPTTSQLPTTPLPTYTPYQYNTGDIPTYSGAAALPTYGGATFSNNQLPTYQAASALPTYQAANFSNAPLPTLGNFNYTNSPIEQYRAGNLPTGQFATYTPDQLSQFAAPNQSNLTNIQNQILQDVLTTPSLSDTDVSRMQMRQNESASQLARDLVQQEAQRAASTGTTGSGYSNATQRRIGEGLSSQILSGNRDIELMRTQQRRQDQLAALAAAEPALAGQAGRAMGYYSTGLGGQLAQSGLNQAGVASQQQATQFDVNRALSQEGLRQAQAASGQAASGMQLSREQAMANQALQQYLSQAEATRYQNDLQRQQADENFRAYGTGADAARFGADQGYRQYQSQADAARYGSDLQQRQADENFRAYGTQADAARFGADQGSQAYQSQLAARQFANTIEGQQAAEGQAGYNTQADAVRFALERAMGQGGLDLSGRGLDLQRELGLLGSAATNRGLDIQRELGLGGLDVDRARIGSGDRQFDQQLAEQMRQFNRRLGYDYSSLGYNANTNALLQALGMF